MWTPPADEKIQDWQPPSDERVGSPPDLRRWDQKAADGITNVMQTIDNPGRMWGNQQPQTNEMSQQGDVLFNKAGEAVTDYLGRRMDSPVVPALAGTAVSMINPENWLSPKVPGIQGKVMEPVVPPERAFDVATAQKYNLPMTRADLTGGVGAARIETGLSGTITGGGAFQDIAAQKIAAVDRAKAYMASKFGTSQPLSASGAEAKIAMQGEMGAAKQTAQGLYKDIPDVPIATPNLEKAINETDFNSIDKSAHPIVQDIRSRIVGAAPPTEQTFPESFGSTQQTRTIQTPGGAQSVPGEGNVYSPPGEKQVTSDLQSQYRVAPTSKDLPVIPSGSKTGDPHALFSYNDNYGPGGSQRSIYTAFGDPAHPVFKTKAPSGTGGYATSGLKSDMDALGIPIVGREPRTVGKWEPLDNLNAGNSSRTQSFQQLNDIRNQLSGHIQSDTTYNPIVGNQVGPKGQALIPLKQALDADIQGYVKSSQGTSYGKLESDQFNTAFTKANTYYGAYKNLQNNKLVQKLSKVPESDISQTIFGQGRIEDVNIAKAALGQEGFNAAKKQFFGDLLESKNIDTTLGKYEPEFLKGVFNDEELNALQEASSLKRTSFTAEKLAGNPSGTAQRVASMATGAGLIDAARRTITNPLGALGEATEILGVPYLASKAYLGTTNGIPYSLGGNTISAARGTGALASSSSQKDLHAEFVRRFVKQSQ